MLVKGVGGGSGKVKELLKFLPSGARQVQLLGSGRSTGITVGVCRRR